MTATPQLITTHDPEPLRMLAGYWLKKAVPASYHEDIVEDDAFATAFSVIRASIEDRDEMRFYVGFESGLAIASAILANPLGDPTQSIMDTLYRYKRELEDAEKPRRSVLGSRPSEAHNEERKRHRQILR